MQQPSIVINDWFQQFTQFVTSNDTQGLTSLLLPGGWFRNHLIFEWNYRTLHGHEEIKDYLDKHLARTQITNLCLEGPDGIPPGFAFGGHAVEAAFTFETPIMWGRGFVLLQEFQGSWKMLSLYFAAVDLKGHEENTQAPSGYYDDHNKTWMDVYGDERTRIEKDPHVIILGAAQNGLHIGARFRQMNIPTLLLDQTDRVGDVWRQRYSTLTLHTPKPHHTLLYTQFPENWPKWTPKEKVANMLEQYASNQDLVIWNRSTILPTPSYDPATKRWTVEVSKDGEKVTLKPYHIVLAIGTLGKPYVPPLLDEGLFNGPKFHATHYKEHHPFVNKNVIVVGACQTAADICQNLALHNAASVTMVQRSSTIVVSAQYLHDTLLDISYPIGVNQKNADFRTAGGIPYGLLKQLQIAGKDKRIADQKEMLDGLTKAGLNINEGDEGAGQFYRVFERLGGMDIGVADLIKEGRVKIKRGEAERFTSDGLVFKDGSFLQADAVIFATGYEPIKNAILPIFGDDLASKITPVWGINEQYELTRAYTPPGHPGIWWGLGDFVHSRYNSKALGIQIKARLAGISHQMSSPRRVTRQSSKAAESSPLKNVNTPSTSRIFVVNDTPTRPSKRVRSTTTTPRTSGRGRGSQKRVAATTPGSSPLKRTRFITRGLSSEEDDDKDQEEEGDARSEMDDEDDDDPDAQFLSALTEKASNLKGKNLILRNSFDAYFTVSSKAARTSNNVFSELIAPLSSEEYSSLLSKSKADEKYDAELKRIWDGHVKLFPRYVLELDEGFNLLFFGFGSKRSLMNEFAKTVCSKRGHVVIVNGFMPGIGIKELFTRIEEVPGVTELPLTSGILVLEAQARRIYDFFLPQAVRPNQRTASAPLFLIIHNIDSPLLRTSKAKSLLSLLALSPRIHIIASIDHIHAELIWSISESSTRKHIYTEPTSEVPSTRGFAWIWHDMTTMRHYDAELAHLNLGSIRGKSNKVSDKDQEMTESAAKHILLSVNAKAKKLFALLAKTLLASFDEASSPSKKDGKQLQTHAIAYSALFNAARADFIATNDTSFQALLAEFRDHGLVLTTVSGGSDCLWIPLRPDELRSVVEGLNIEQ
ncbi:hypothetical protein Clacol_010046 [Clathrus columnatus]|uniref:Flavin-containing monooxygenase n=1 Tax=Clathrus columnatus TaxID=1419009 RepID=A0AAV5AQJ4_9AGAM|nr:hypothetical protein Clacol_010046 [Clathrus columnatus]